MVYILAFHYFYYYHCHYQYYYYNYYHYYYFHFYYYHYCNYCNLMYVKILQLEGRNWTLDSTRQVHVLLSCISEKL